MKITAPVRLSSEAESLIEAGARELYVGYAPKAWTKLYGNVGSPNRRYFKETSVNEEKDLKRTIEIAHSRDVPVFLAVNTPYYINDQRKPVLEQFRLGMKFGVDAFIVSDLAAMLMLKKQYPHSNLIVSGVSTVFNSKTAQFYKDLGAKRIILPRQLTIKEVEGIVKNVDGIEYETFMLFDWCKNIDGFCTFHHGVEDLIGAQHGCTYLDKYNVIKGADNPGRISANQKMHSLKFNMFCAACMLYDLNRIGLNSVKIAGRSFPIEIRLKGTTFIDWCIKLAQRSKSREDYIEKAQELYSDHFDRRCSRKNCNVLMI